MHEQDNVSECVHMRTCGHAYLITALKRANALLRSMNKQAGITFPNKVEYPF